MEAEIYGLPAVRLAPSRRQCGAAYVVIVLVVFELIFVLILILGFLIFLVRDIGAM
jgi:hypothetical protein